MSGNNKKSQNPQSKAGRGGQQAKRSQKQNNGGGQRRFESSQGPNVRAPIQQSRSQKTGRATFSATKEGILVCNRELITLIESPATGYSISNRLRCNPGSAVCFPWLSTMANSWETYRFRKLKFNYIARCPTTTSGTVLLSPDYDAQDGPPANEVVQSAMKGTVEDAPWKNIVMVMSPANLNRTYKAHFTMDDGRFATTTQDEKTIDAAQVFVGIDVDAALKLGKLWVEYECELNTPQPPEVNEAVGSSQHDVNLVPMTGANPFPNTVTLSSLRQNDADPIIEMIAGQGTNANVSFARFIRPFTGTVNMLLHTLSAGTFSPGGATNLTALLNDVALPIMGGSTRYGNNAATSTLGEMITGRFSANIGDILGVAPLLGSAGGTATIRMLLQGLV